MPSFPVPSNEAARQAALDQTCGLVEGGDPRLDALAAEVRRVTGCPTGLVSLVDTDRQVFSGRSGFPQRQTARDYLICAHVILSDRDLVIPDTHETPRFRTHPVVVNPPHVRFYAGTPIVLRSGFRVGSLCALDYAPRDAPSPAVMDRMRALARQAAEILEGGDPPPPAAHLDGADEVPGERTGACAVPSRAVTPREVTPRRQPDAPGPADASPGRIPTSSR
ncbi:GAF domain-containing protein [Jannaschia ovalis]|uniref:GAF domain-containing protein n=1 Tax=Jannaschia ovalis TaxID=3038773 RepID=A0ABY8L9B7_9RHOB|nr:GAF domain-containing protein [Jannaschia sp. GRR-S6-38]WGH77949.1 GAF domain-containing protein [Jannaschia sp. GRR-S6-38]